MAAGPRCRVQAEAVERRTERLVVPERARLRPRQAALPGGARGRRLARDGGRREPALRAVVAPGFVVAPGLEQVPAAQTARHPADRMFEHLAHLPRLQVPRRGPQERGALFAVDAVAVDAVEDESVEVGMKPNVGRGPLDDRECARLAVGRVGALCVERLDALEKDAGERAKKRAVAGEDGSPRKREREHPLAPRGITRENVLDHVGGRCAHAPADAGGAEATALARERHEQAVRAGAATEPREASAEDAAAQIRIELLLRVFGHTHRERAVVDGAVQGLEVVTDDLVQRRRLGAMTRVRPRDRAGRG